MPYFETEIDIDVEEFWDSCSNREKKQLINYIKEFDGSMIYHDDSKGKTICDLEWESLMSKLLGIRRNMTIEEEDIIRKIVNRY